MRAEDIHEGREYAFYAPLGSGGFQRRTGINRQVARLRVEQINPDGTLVVARPNSGTKYRYRTDGVLRPWPDHQQQKRDALQAAELCRSELRGHMMEIKGNGSHGLVEFSMDTRTAVQLLRRAQKGARA